MKKRLSILLAAIMLISLLPVSAFAESEVDLPETEMVQTAKPSDSDRAISPEETNEEKVPADDTETNTTDVQIELFAETQIFDGGTGTGEDPFLISNGDQLILVNDLDTYCFKLISDFEVTSWSPIVEFKGTLDGDGHTVSGLTSQFVTTNKGTIKNIGVVSSDSGVKADALFVGTNKGTIENSFAKGTVSSAHAGFVYFNGGIIKNCYFDGKVNSGGSAAGFVFYNNYNNTGTITNCYFKGEITVGDSKACGFVYDASHNYDMYGKITNCYSVATLRGSRKCGFGDSASNLVSYCYYNRQTSGCSDTDFASPTYTLAMKMQATYTGWDFDTVWAVDENINDGYPYLRNCASSASNLVQDIQLNRTSAVVKIGDTFTLNAAITPNDTGRSVSWSSSAPSVASVSNGVVTAKSIGTAVITASIGSVKAQCTVEVADNAVSVTGLTLDKTSFDLVLGEETTLSAAVTPSDATNKSVTWTNSNSTAVSFDKATGKVKALAEGSAVITAVTTDGGYRAECRINVYDNSIKVTSVTLDKIETGIIIGESVTLKPTVLPVNATNTAVKWTSMNPSVAVVSNTGVVTGVAEGTTQIYATSASNSSCYAICRITVASVRVPVTGISFGSNPFGTPQEVNIGKTLRLSPTITPSNATNKEIKWTSNDSDIATVVNGTVTGIAEGTATITATTADGGYTSTCTVKVTKPTVYVTGIALNTEQMSVEVRGTKKLTAVVTPEDATDKTITFKSNNNAIANVSSDGTVTGVSPGTTLIQAISDTSAGRFVAFCTVTVPKPVIEVTSVKLDKGSIEVVEGKTVPLKAVVKPSNATYKNITWSTSDESIVTVSQDGYITAQGVGEAVVSATAVNGKNTVCNVTVLSTDTPAQLKVEDATVKAGKQVPITVSIASNPGISTFNFDLKYDNTKMYPVSYTKGDVLNKVNIITPLGSQSFKDRNSVRFLCSTTDSKNMDNDGDLITVVFQTLDNIEYGEETIEIIPSAFTNQNYEAINLQSNNCKLNVTDYIIGDVNCDDVVDLKDSMVLGQYIAGFGVELTAPGKKAAVSIYPDENDNVETSEPSLNDFQHLFRYLSDWQVELGKN